MSNSITFANFDRVLANLGFRKKVVPKQCVTYEHVPTETMLVVRLHKPNETVPWHVLSYVRQQLDWRGVIEARALDELLQSAAA